MNAFHDIWQAKEFDRRTWIHPRPRDAPVPLPPSSIFFFFSSLSCLHVMIEPAPPPARISRRRRHCRSGWVVGSICRLRTAPVRFSPRRGTRTRVRRENHNYESVSASGCASLDVLRQGLGGVNSPILGQGACNESRHDKSEELHIALVSGSEGSLLMFKIWSADVKGLC